MFMGEKVMSDHPYKKIEFVNFNCTFGEENEPLLEHFDDVLYPALTAGYTFKKKGMTEWKIRNVHIDIMNDTYVLIGAFVKDTIIEVKSHSSGNDIVPANEQYPSSPYSIFVLSLKNHRMAFYRNQSGSPQVRSMRTIVSDCVKRYLRSVNKNRDKHECLPRANIHIAPIPSKTTIEERFKDIEKIQSLSFKIFPLNGDPDVSDAFRLLREANGTLGSNSLSVQIPSPKNIHNVKESIQNLNGTAIPRVKATTVTGIPVVFDEDSFTESAFFKVDSTDPHDVITDKICNHIKDYDIMNNTSEENDSIYKRFINKIKALIYKESDKNE